MLEASHLPMESKIYNSKETRVSDFKSSFLNTHTTGHKVSLAKKKNYLFRIVLNLF